MENTVLLSKEEFDRLIKTEEIKAAYTYYVAAPSLLRNRVQPSSAWRQRFFTYQGTTYVESSICPQTV